MQCCPRSSTDVSESAAGPQHDEQVPLAANANGNANAVGFIGTVNAVGNGQRPVPYGFHGNWIAS
jgi:hypothetical protein